MCAERYGWTWEYIMDGAPLGAIMLMTRQPGPFRPEADGFSMDELDLLDWMADNKVQPGGDCSGFFNEA